MTDVYYKESARYVRIKFETEEEATAFRAVAKLVGLTVDGFNVNRADYKRSVYINNVHPKQ